MNPALWRYTQTKLYRNYDKPSKKIRSCNAALSVMWLSHKSSVFYVCVCACTPFQDYQLRPGPIIISFNMYGIRLMFSYTSICTLLVTIVSARCGYFDRWTGSSCRAASRRAEPGRILLLSAYRSKSLGLIWLRWWRTWSRPHRTVTATVQYKLKFGKFRP